MSLLTDSRPLTETELARINPRIRLKQRAPMAEHAAVARELPSTATPRSFGSRTDLESAGGVIHLPVQVPGSRFDDQQVLSARLQAALIAEFGERKVNLVITPATDNAATPFSRLAQASAVKLHP